MQGKVWRPMNHLHEKQKQILEELAERHARGQSAPSTRELRALLGAKSPAVPEYHLKKLEASGPVLHEILRGLVLPLPETDDDIVFNNII